MKDKGHPYKKIKPLTKKKPSSSLNENDEEIDIDIVNFINKRNARLSSRVTRSQKKEDHHHDCVDLEEDDTNENLVETPAAP